MLQGIPATFADGDLIFEQGDPAADMYLVVSGAVRIVRTTPDAAEVELGVLGAGEFFGEMGLFAPGPRIASAVAIGPTELDAIDVATFKSSIPEPVVWRMLSRMSERIREAYDFPERTPGVPGEPLT